MFILGEHAILGVIVVLIFDVLHVVVLLLVDVRQVVVLAIVDVLQLTVGVLGIVVIVTWIFFNVVISDDGFFHIVIVDLITCEVRQELVWEAALLIKLRQVEHGVARLADVKGLVLHANLLDVHRHVGKVQHQAELSCRILAEQPRAVLDVDLGHIDLAVHAIDADGVHPCRGGFHDFIVPEAEGLANVLAHGLQALKSEMLPKSLVPPSSAHGSAAAGVNDHLRGLRPQHISRGEDRPRLSGRLVDRHDLHGAQAAVGIGVRAVRAPPPVTLGVLTRVLACPRQAVDEVRLVAAHGESALPALCLQLHHGPTLEIRLRGAQRLRRCRHSRRSGSRARTPTRRLPVAPRGRHDVCQ